ncbi:MAG: GNAT family N-acetyltransferase [Proteobacteria bacterium]|nr:GNAT family N-acetyltransferase [Pseudomonadota bacterium]
MTQVHVVTSANRHLYGDILESYHRIRHDVFVKERGWKAIERTDGRDIDAYDHDNTVHLIAIEGDRVVGGERLTPTTSPHMLNEVFPALAAIKGVPIGDSIWEGSRYFVVRERRVGRTDCMLLAALQEFALDEGITHYSIVIETWWLPRLHEAGFVVRPLGLPTLIENQWALAAAIDVGASNLEQARALGGITGSVLVRRGPQIPLVRQVEHAT